MGWNDFGRSLWFAAGAGFLTIPALTLLSRAGGGWPIPQLILTVVLAVYVAGLAPDRGRSLRAGALTFGAGLLVYAATRNLGEMTVGLAAVLAVSRSGLLLREGTAGQRFAVEGLLGALGLGTAHVVFDASAYSFAGAVWTFFLVQSAYPLFSSQGVSGVSTADIDEGVLGDSALDGVEHG